MGEPASTRRRANHAPAPWVGDASRWLLALGVAGSGLAVGAVHTETLCVVTVVLAASAFLGWWGSEPLRARAPATVLLVTGIVLTGYTAAQCVPMPVAWLRVLSPHSADVWSRALAPLHEAGPSWAPLSLDPIASRVEVLKGAAYVLAFVAALRVARRKDGVTFLSAIVVLTAMALALAAVLHPAFGARRLFGVYEPGPSIAARHIAPLMNANNLAGYLTIGVCLALASLLAPEPRVPRPITGAIVLLLIAAQLWVASRGGVITMGLGALVVVTVAHVSRTRRASAGATTSLTLVSSLGMVAGATAIVLGGSEEASGELFDTNVSKLTMFSETVHTLPSIPLLGWGRGAFESAFAVFRTTPGYFTYTYPENVVVQWLSEWGLPVGTLGLVAIAVALRPNIVLARSATAGGAWGALVALTIQNMGDLGTEVPGLMLPLVVCAALVTAGTTGSKPRWKIERWAAVPRWVALGAGVAGVVPLVLALTTLGKGLHDDQRAMREAAIDVGTSAGQMHAMARAAMVRHPAEPYVPFTTALRAVRRGDDSPMPWIAATLERAAVYGPAHLVLARTLSGAHPAQARLEYRLAMEQAPNLVGDVMTEAPRVIHSFDDADELVPHGKDADTIRDLLVVAVEARLPSTAARIDATLLSQSQPVHHAVLRVAEKAVDDLEAGDAAPWCQGSARPACVDAAARRATQVEQLMPDQCTGYALHARTLVAGGSGTSGVKELDGAVDHVADRVVCLEELVKVARSVHNDVVAQSALDRILNAGCDTPTECANKVRWVARAYEDVNRPMLALALYRKAFDIAPDDVLLAYIAMLASGAGLFAESAEDYTRLSRKHPDNPEWARRAAEARNAAMREAQRL